MHRVTKERHLGSLFGDVRRIAEYVGVARATHDVTVWLNPQGEMVYSSADLAPELPPQYLLGTYGTGADVADIQADLIAFRNERASNAMIF